MNARMFVPDRATLALAVAVGGAYLFLGAPLALAIATALLVCFVRGLLEAALAYRRSPRPLPGTPEALWVFRAEAAVAAIRRLRASAGSGVVAYRCSVIAKQAADAVVILRRLAYQSGLVSRLAGGTDLAELRRTDASLRHQIGVLSDGPARQQNEYALRSLAARIEAAALGLEGLVARVAEIVALSEFGSGIAAPQVDELAAELDTLRAALVETENLGRHALSDRTEIGR